MSENEIKVVDRRWWAREGGASVEAQEPSLKPTYVEELEKRLAEKDSEIQTYLSKYRDASSGFDEARARLRKETSKEIERGRRAVLVEFLEVLDNLDRAIDAAAEALESGETSKNFEGLLQGIVMVHQQFLAKLEGFQSSHRGGSGNQLTAGTFPRQPSPAAAPRSRSRSRVQ
jgi:molecular chaperone GrpE (heat shock protein)